MNADVYAAIAEYLKGIQNEVIWPTVGKAQDGKAGSGPAYRPDLLWLFRLNLMKWYLQSIRVFPKPAPKTGCESKKDSDCPEDRVCVNGECVTVRARAASRPCSIDEDCAQDEICVGGDCVPVVGGSYALQAKCTIDEECAQDEICIGGECVPVPWEEEYQPIPVTGSDRQQADAVAGDLREAIESYLGRINGVLVAGLAAKHTQLSAVRNLLMSFRIDAMKIAGTGNPCKVSAETPQDHVCLRGLSVKVPFRLGFRSVGAKPRAPWN